MPDFEATTDAMAAMMTGMLQRMPLAMPDTLPTAPVIRAVKASSGLVPWMRMSTDAMRSTASRDTT